MATVRYDEEVDIITVDTAPDIRIGVSSSVVDGLIADYKSEATRELVGIEFWAAHKHLAPFCASTEKEAAEARRAAQAFVVKTDYDREKDILTVSTSHEVSKKVDSGAGIIAYFGYWDSSCEPCEKCSDLVGFELHNASECLAPYFRLNRDPLDADDSD